MSAPRVIAELVVTGIRVLGKATAAAGAQAVRNFKVKPEGAAAATSSPSGGGGKGAITSQLNMSLDEAHLILNVKKDDPMDIIQKNYERIFAANGPPAPPAADAVAKAGAAAAAQARRSTAAASAKKSKIPTHSHYLHSKVFRALERIKAEREADAPPSPPSATTAEAAAETASEVKEEVKEEVKKPEPEYKKPGPAHSGRTIEL